MHIKNSSTRVLADVETAQKRMNWLASKLNLSMDKAEVDELKTSLDDKLDKE